MEDVNKGLIDAAVLGDEKILGRCLKRGANVNYQDMNKWSALHWAAGRGHVRIIELLLKCGGDPNLQDSDGWSPLTVAADNGQLEAVRVLVNHGSDPSIEDQFGDCPIHNAAAKGHKKIAQLFLDVGIDPNLKGLSNQTALHYAASMGQPGTVRLLLDRGGDPEMKDLSGKSPYDVVNEESPDNIDDQQRKIRVKTILMKHLEKLKQDRAAIVLNELRCLGFETAVELQEIMQLGEYNCYWNRVYAVGPYASGKSCLAKILVGEPVPKERESTDGIWIYFGRAGMDIETEEWKFFPKGDAIKELLTSMLMALSKAERNKHATSDVSSEEEFTNEEHRMSAEKKSPNPDSTISGDPELKESRNVTRAVIEQSIDNPELLFKNQIGERKDHATSVFRDEKGFMNEEHRMSAKKQSPTLDAAISDDKLLKESRNATMAFVEPSFEYPELLSKRKVRKRTPLSKQIMFRSLDIETCPPIIPKEENNLNSGVVDVKDVFRATDDDAAPIPTIKPGIAFKSGKHVSKSKKNEAKLLFMVRYNEDRLPGQHRELSNNKIHKLVIKAIEDGKYKQTITPIDIWDFGGQKDYYMTHQLFITSRGIFVLIFNGNLNLNKKRPDLAFLPGHFGKPTLAVYLLHWVNSILTYCKRSEGGFPRILFVATHKDKVNKRKIEEQRNKLMNEIGELFKSHAGLHHLEFRPLIFVNALDEADPELQILRRRLMTRAVEHPRWGELMPTAWIPLELQLALQVEQNVHILSTKEIRTLNSQNESMVLTDKQLETFLKVQHSLGKLLYFDTVTLREFVIIQPTYLVEVLRSIVTEKQFWPKGKRFGRVLEIMRDTGFIDREDIYFIWNQDTFNHILPHKEFMIEMFVHLDILIAPRRDIDDLSNTIQDVTRFLVPCMITNPNKTKYLKKYCTSKKAIFMAYTFIEEVIPPAFAYRFLGSFVTIGHVKLYKRNRRLLFSDLAVVQLDENHDIALQVKENKIIVSLIHSEHKKHIVPTLASSVQECLTAAVHRISEFYSTLSEDSSTSKQKDHMVMPFEIDFGVHCKKTLCFFRHREMPTAVDHPIWYCFHHKQTHNVGCLRLWFSEKISCDRCPETCVGLGKLELEQFPTEMHLRRLVAKISSDDCRQLMIRLGIDVRVLDDVNKQFQHLHPDDSKFTAIARWMHGTSNATFLAIKNALERCNLDKHLLCQAFRDVKPDPLGISEDTMNKIPSIGSLLRVSNHIGNSSMQLGIELGLCISDIHHIQYQHKDKLLEQTREILKTWRQKSYPQPNVRLLIKAMYRIGKISCLKGIKF